jgi:putative peptidoglycan lipid II flippase
MGSAVGLLAMTMGRLYASAFYALKDTRTPFRYAALRVVLTASMGYWASLILPRQIGLPTELGAAGLLATAGIAAWIECLLLRRKLGQRIGRAVLPMRTALTLYGIAALAAMVGLAVKLVLVSHFGARAIAAEWGGEILPAPKVLPVVAALLILTPYGLVYFVLTWAVNIPESRAFISRLGKRVIKR